MTDRHRIELRTTQEDKARYLRIARRLKCTLSEAIREGMLLLEKSKRKS